MKREYHMHVELKTDRELTRSEESTLENTLNDLLLKFEDHQCNYDLSDYNVEIKTGYLKYSLDELIGGLEIQKRKGRIR